MDDDMKIVGQNQKIRMNKKLKLGRGWCGTVFTGQFRAVRCAVKRIELDAMNQMVSDNFKIELDILKSSIHANIVRYLYDDEDDNFYYIAMELCKYSMYDYIKDQGYDAIGNDALVIRIIYQCASGVEYLHGKSITHRDIKPANMLLSEISDYVTIKLADFGMCKVLDPDKSSTVSSEKGTTGYNAYEIAKRLRNKLRCDIFSLAIAFHEFSTQGGHPFGGTDRREAQLNIKKKKKPYLGRVVSKPFGELITEMLNHNLEERPTASHVLADLKTIFTGDKDQLGQAIASSLLFPEKNVTTDESKDLLKENVSHAEHRVEYTVPVQSSLQAVPATPKDESGSPSPKRRKSEAQGNKRKKAVTKNPAEKIEQLISDYKVPKSKLKSETPNAQLRNAEFSIHRRKWQEAINFLDCAVNLLEPMGTVKAQFLFDQAEKAASKFLYVMSILLHVCSASQFRNEGLAKDGASKTSECVYKIYKVTMDSLRPKATDRNVLTGIDVRYKDIAQYFVIPLVTSECKKLKQFCKTKKLPVFEAAKQNAYAVSWFSVLLNYLENFEKTAEMAETARKEIVPYCSLEYRTYSRLLQEEGKAKTQLEKYDEAANLLNRALYITKKYENNVEKRKTNIHFINKAIEDNEAKRVDQFAGVLDDRN